MIDPDIKRLEERLSLETHKVITCGVAASHPDASLAHRSPYNDKWNSPQAESVRKLRGNFDSLRAAVRRWIAADDAMDSEDSCTADMIALADTKRALRAEMAGIDGGSNKEQKP